MKNGGKRHIGMFLRNVLFKALNIGHFLRNFSKPLKIALKRKNERNDNIYIFTFVIDKKKNERL